MFNTLKKQNLIADSVRCKSSLIKSTYICSVVCTKVKQLLTG